MRIDRTHRVWLIGSVLVLALALAVYIPYARGSQTGPDGGSPLGLTYGIAGFAFMIFAGLLGARKKVPLWRVGRARTWMRGHLWLGTLALPLIFLHAGFVFGGLMTTVLMVLLIIVVVSGLVGAALQHYMPKRMTREVELETIYAEIPSIRKQLLAEADGLIKALLESAPEEAGAGEPLPDDQLETERNEREALDSWYTGEVRPFLVAPKANPNPFTGVASRPMREMATPGLGAAIDDLESICEENRQLRRQETLHLWLHGWLLTHVPLSLALLVLGAVHAVMALRY